jgi:site-specific recombinase XerD
MQPLVEQYVAFRQRLGERCITNGRILRAFSRFLGPTVKADEVPPEQVERFLAGKGAITSAWHINHNALVGFYRYAVSRGYLAKAPLPTMIPKRAPAFVPYIYSREDLKRLLNATDSYQRNRSSMEPITVRTIILLLYGAGLRVREALFLNTADVDMGAGVLTIRDSKFFKSRLVPFGPQLGRALVTYSRRPRSADVTGMQRPFFTTRNGIRVNQDTLNGCFQRVRARAGIHRETTARYQPRLHDLRHAFAVHRLTLWYRQGKDVQKLLPHLSVYMGHAHLVATQVYLTMTPELLGQAGLRFERYAAGGKP